MKIREKIGNGTLLVTDGNLKYIEFEWLNEYGEILAHCMSTRIGGCSTGECGSLNLGFNRNDSRENVMQNFRMICKSAGFPESSLVLTNQVHGNIIRTVDRSDMGKGFGRESDLTGVDGLLTQAEGVTLVTFHADCVPVFLFEPVIRAASLVHSGWMGTLKGIAAEAVKKMAGLPHFSAGRLIAVLGPSIGSCCFEVREDVYSMFADKYKDTSKFQQTGDNKWKIDLHGIIKSDLIQNGLREDNIHTSCICTRCRNDLFFSYRGDNGRTGSMAAFMQIRNAAVRSCI